MDTAFNNLFNVTCDWKHFEFHVVIKSNIIKEPSKRKLVEMTVKEEVNLNLSLGHSKDQQERRMKLQDPSNVTKKKKKKKKRK